MRILLTGASGFIGKHLQAALLEEGHHVVCAVRRPLHSGHTHLTYIASDFVEDTDKSVWLARLHGVDAVINAVGIFREHGKQTFAALHSEAPRALFAACAESDTVRLVLQLSALGADDDANTAYHQTKKVADDFLMHQPLRAFILQPSLVYGKGGASAAAFKTLASMPFGVRFGNAAQLVQPIHVDDLVAAVLALIRQPLSIAPDMPKVIATQRVALVGPQALSFTDYLRTLRCALGMGKLHVLPLPGSGARLLARLRLGWLNPEALRMLERGNHADASATARLLGRPARSPATFIDNPRAERIEAKLGWLLPVLRWSVAFVWLATAIVSAGVYPVQDSYQLLERSGVPANCTALMLYGAVGVDLLLGLGTLLLKRRRWLWLVQLGLIGFYTVFIAFKLPEFLLHPYGPLTKNLPMLAVIWLLYELEEN